MSDAESSLPGIKPQEKIPDEVAHQAVTWLVQWQSASDPDAEWQSILRWRESNPLHEQAWQHIEKVNRKMGVLVGPAGSNIAHRVLTDHGHSRRQVIKTSVVVLITTAAAWQSYRLQPWQRWVADYSTEVGEQREVRLADGTILHLNSRTSVDISYSASERRLVLIEGQVHIQTAPASMPMIVQVAQGEISPLGTRFVVSQKLEHCEVGVYEGSVRIATRQRAQVAITDAGQSRSFTSSEISLPFPAKADDSAWIEGVIIASDMKLVDFLAELNRHRYGLIQCDPAVANLKISGTYPLDQAESVLAALEQALPVKLNYYTRFWVRVVPG